MRQKEATHDALEKASNMYTFFYKTSPTVRLELIILASESTA
jgi:hypothetical protein